MRTVVLVFTLVLLTGCGDSTTEPAPVCNVTGYYESVEYVDTIDGTEYTILGEKLVESNCDLNEPWCHCFDDLR